MPKCNNCHKMKEPGQRECPHCGIDSVGQQGMKLQKQIDQKRADAGLVEGASAQDHNLQKPPLNHAAFPDAGTNTKEPSMKLVCVKCNQDIPPGINRCPKNYRHEVQTVVDMHEDHPVDESNGGTAKSTISVKTSEIYTSNVDTVGQDQNIQQNAKETMRVGVAVQDTSFMKYALNETESIKKTIISRLIPIDIKSVVGNSKKTISRHPNLSLFVLLFILVIIFSSVVSIFRVSLSDFVQSTIGSLGSTSVNTQIVAQNTDVNPTTSNVAVTGTPLTGGNVTNADTLQATTNALPDNGNTVGSLPTSSQKDTTPPLRIGEPTAIVSGRSATIVWSTDKPAKSMVKYGLTQSCEFPSIETSSYRNNQHIFIDSLSPGTTYYYQLISIDESNNKMVSKSGEFSFKTELLDNELPYVGNAAPEFKLKTLDGSEVSLSQLRGKKVILDFWADWCSACKVEMPHLQLISDKLRDSGVVVLTIATGDSDVKKLNAIVKDSGYTFKVALDSNDHVLNVYGVTSLPVTYFIDAGGVIRKYQRGMFTSPGEIEFMLNSY